MSRLDRRGGGGRGGEIKERDGGGGRAGRNSCRWFEESLNSSGGFALCCGSVGLRLVVRRGRSQA